MKDLDYKKPENFIKDLCYEVVKECLERRKSKLTMSIKLKIDKHIQEHEKEFKDMFSNFPKVSKMDMELICEKLYQSCEKTIREELDAREIYVHF